MGNWAAAARGFEDPQPVRVKSGRSFAGTKASGNPLLWQLNSKPVRVRSLDGILYRCTDFILSSSPTSYLTCGLLRPRIIINADPVLQWSEGHSILREGGVDFVCALEGFWQAVA